MVPHKPVDKELDMPDWLELIEGHCLQEILIEALVARACAVRNNAESNPRANTALVAGDKTIDQIAQGRYKGRLACKKAADALRKFTQALNYTASVKG